MQTIQFTRDSSGGRVKIDKEGRPVVSYWPCPTTRQHLMEVGGSCHSMSWVVVLLH